MVQVTGFQKRKSTISDNADYFALELQADEIEFVISKNTGRYYATVRKCWMSSTFNEQMCKMMIGKSMTGSIVKVECDPYSFVVEETGEEITRSHRFEYCPVETEEAEQLVFGSKQMALA